MSNEKDPAYFAYYAQFVHQQNMLQDTVRTSFYQSAIAQNGPDHFKDKIVMDVGAGSGILSYFALQAGAKMVYAVEASGMATRIQKMVDAAITKNPWMHGRIKVIQGKIEDVTDIPLVDTIISEPIGVLLVHERMLESYLVARDRFLKPGGTLIPSAGTIAIAPFTDHNLWLTTMTKVRFWEQDNFYGVDFSPLVDDAREEIFGQPVVGAFDPRSVLGEAVRHIVDFRTISMEELQNMTIPIKWKIPYTGIIHGIAGWFDIDLGGINLSTAPGADRTHWQQVRFLFKEPLAVNAFETIVGHMKLVVNQHRSYDITAEVTIVDENAGHSDIVALDDMESDGSLSRHDPQSFRRRGGKWGLHEQTYWYAYDPHLQPAVPENRPELVNLYQPDMASRGGDVGRLV
ncbi:S-adenosyl-L-methionine-dependent methyltransferase [Polychytrium aggregatum]|uniref:S-adenosyl-L-methionine-dependent methyltransferase n=1 Tax=Polychytrium aggregatum TaxID=110093 RepID=UPI0022FDF419|nr:S-adenosyl-L-methionine-dependent methyltransferase [Polychytrium aggregatum]KAI9199319.1 S-adenosyl-L-methionine-dependent methyltransferase [Polychytrium aggregatum]